MDSSQETNFTESMREILQTRFNNLNYKKASITWSAQETVMLVAENPHVHTLVVVDIEHDAAVL